MYFDAKIDEFFGQFVPVSRVGYVSRCIGEAPKLLNNLIPIHTLVLSLCSVFVRLGSRPFVGKRIEAIR